MEISGVIKQKYNTVQVSDKFKKREFVLTTEANTPYPQHILFQLTQEKTSVLDKYSVGDEVSVSFNLRGRKWNGPQGTKYFNTLEAWFVKGIDKNSQEQGSPEQASSNPRNPMPQVDHEDFNDDLPF